MQAAAQTLMLEENQLFSAVTVYRERGAYLRRLEQLEKAKCAYDEAYKFNPEDVRVLVGRSQVYTDEVKPAQAYEDAERALQIEPQNMIASSMQARAMYARSEFERATVINYRGSRLRSQPPYFKEGIIQGLETIEECVGKNVGSIMTEMKSIIKKLEEARFDELGLSRRVHQSRIPKMKSQRSLNFTEIRKHELLSRVLAMKYLGPMASDKFFIQKLKENNAIYSANEAGSQELKKKIDEAYTALCERQEMLRTQRPYYTIKAVEQTASKHLIKHKKEILWKEVSINTKIAERFIDSLYKCQKYNQISRLISVADRFQIFMDTKSKRTFPDLVHFTDRMYRIIGDSFLGMYRLSYQLSEYGNCRRIAFLMGMPVKHSKLHDSVVANYPRQLVPSKETVEKLHATKEICENVYRKCYLLYCLSRVHAGLKNYPLSKFYAKKCQRAAEEVDCTSWWLNGCLAMMAGDVQQGNVHDVHLKIEEAFEWGKTHAISDDFRLFLYKCLEVVGDISYNLSEEQANAKRQKDILSVMDEKTRTDAEVLFKRMATVPIGRRFSVLPGVLGKSKLVERRRIRQLGLSVVPGPDKGVVRSPVSNIMGLQRFDL